MQGSGCEHVSGEEAPRHVGVWERMWPRHPGSVVVLMTLGGSLDHVQ